MGGWARVPWASSSGPALVRGAGLHMSLDLYMSERSLVMGTLPMVFLKNTSSMVEGLTERREGRRRRSFPKRQGWVGYLKDISQGSRGAPPRARRRNEGGACAQSQATAPRAAPPH